MTESLEQPQNTDSFEEIPISEDFMSRTAQAMGGMAVEEGVNNDIDGVVAKILFKREKQKELLARVDRWFQEKKDSFPKEGLSLMVPRFTSDGAQTPGLSRTNTNVFSRPEGAIDAKTDIVVPECLVELFDAVIKDSVGDLVIGQSDTQFVLERTGSKYTQLGDNEFHVDTKQIYWNEKNERIGYDTKRSKPAYLIFVGRPGTLIVHQTLDPSLNQHQANAFCRNYMLNSADGKVYTSADVLEPTVSQLLPNSIYEVAVGDIPHSPPLHDDGLLITVRFNTNNSLFKKK